MGIFSPFLACVCLFIPFYLRAHASPVLEPLAGPLPVETTTFTLSGHVTTQTLSFDSVKTLGVTGSFPPRVKTTTSPKSASTVSPAHAGKPNPIKAGLTTFGDSFAAGFGTGFTSTDSCRQGEFSYDRILTGGAPEGIAFERRECSGAIVTEVLQGPGAAPDNQMEAWKNISTSDIVTLSIGGNDLGFADIIDGCFTRFLLNFSPDCTKSIARARDLLQNGTLQSFIEITLVQIIKKSTRDDLKVFLTGYPALFNVGTTFCNDVSFAFFVSDPINRPEEPCTGSEKPCLAQEIRRTANDLSAGINRVLDAAAQRVNAQEGHKVHFIDPNPAFNGHRFCEVDNEKEVREPDPGRADTWFFLSLWPDNKLDGTLLALEGESADPALGNSKMNTTAIPASSTVCTNTSDPDNYFLCAIAQINEDPTSPVHQRLVQDQLEIQAGNFSASHVTW